jgi:hypothetical protein
MPTFDENFKRTAAETRRADARAEERKRGQAEEFAAKKRSAEPVIARVCRDVAAVLRVGRVPIETDDGWSLPELPAILSARPRYVLDERVSTVLGKRWKLDTGSRPWATLTPDAALLSDRYASSVRRSRAAEREARVRAVHQAIAVTDVQQLAASTIELDYGMSHRLVLDRVSRTLFVCAGAGGDRPSVVPFEEYGHRAAECLVAAWEKRPRGDGRWR